MQSCSQCIHIMSAISCNACSQSLVPFLDCTVNHLLIKTVQFCDAQVQLFHVLDLVSINALLQNPHTALLTGFRSGLLGGDSESGMKSVRALMQHTWLIIN